MQGFNEELPKAVAHITQQLIEQGTLPNAFSVRVFMCEVRLLREFGECQLYIYGGQCSRNGGV